MASRAHRRANETNALRVKGAGARLLLHDGPDWRLKHALSGGVVSENVNAPTDIISEFINGREGIAEVDSWVKRRTSMAQQDRKGRFKDIEMSENRPFPNPETATDTEQRVGQRVLQAWGSPVYMGKTVKGPGWMVNREGLKGEKHQNMFKEKQNGHEPKKPNHPLQSFCIRLDDAEGIEEGIRRRELVKWYADPRERERGEKASSVKNGGRSHRVGVPLAVDRTRIKQSGGSKWSTNGGGGDGVSQRTSEPMSVMAAVLRTPCRGSGLRAGSAGKAGMQGGLGRRGRVGGIKHCGTGFIGSGRKWEPTGRLHMKFAEWIGCGGALFKESGSGMGRM
ncbi:hypothetical protein B0H14DRAFT_2567498 [Mycena olivaceomarginata]|nr:hypothetical protein B0H14DRAFT_2567498 [Mycena olivaceomarginata]